MAKKKEPVIAGIDIGSTKAGVMVGKVSEAGALEFIAAASAECRGLRKGIVVNLEEVVACLKRLMPEVEAQAGAPVESAYVGLSGAHVRGFNNRGVVPIKGRNHEITVDDVRRVVDAARAVTIPADKEIIHVLPQSYCVDGQDGISDPLGMSGSRLEVNVHIVTASVMATQNIVNAVNRCGIMVSKLVLQQLAAAEAVLTPDERELGCLLVDIGGGTTDVVVYYRGMVWHSVVLPIGGDNFTRDLAVGLRTPLNEAERLKREFGCAIASAVDKEEYLEVSGVGGRASRPISRAGACEIIQPRAEEILHFVREQIEKLGLQKQLTAGAVLTGGGSLLQGLVDLTEQTLEMPARRGATPGEVSLGALSTEWLDPKYATSVGLVRHGYQALLHPQRNGLNGHQTAKAAGSMLGGFRNWWRNMLY